ncbi:glycoside hydrolase family 3 protein [Pseudoalteromonas sp. MMG022]|uniref:glycoside hydrolase family 3 protein n=1 Tax=Pseudoalteromonas sp. MMG022 TaxID=2909978 RepID=UPI001F342402|nr:glycoside hydrolase family 3 protein [Pseudoalteromonas sp. MMG022]MCF6434512.1 glycoside hydrolase family 3 protein [Pseudoalteromonas sp. MMG022]
MTISNPSLASTTPDLPLEVQLGQKLMLDFRYFCQQGQSETCRTPMTTLPPELADILSKYHIGGVILFSENTQDIAQIVNLNNQLQSAAQNAKHPQPLFIAIDQEGGRVARINRAQATSFTGNMSIGATYPLHNTHYATKVASAIGKELASLGINVNFAPTVDVNMNADNPVINVRSFSENPDVVAELGAEQVKAFEQQNVISALKHFPGHGDTHVDSHTGLPRVDHDEQTIWQNDLAPFQSVINTNSPGMIMTAHIQYPALDSSTVQNKHGEQMLKPATMSRKIMHNLLRDKLGYQGVIITDALDMAGISDFFDAEAAVIETFKAGVDIALMPIAMRTPSDIKKLEQLLQALTNAVSQGVLDEQEVARSAQRIHALKDKFIKSNTKVSANIAHSTLGNPAHRKLEAELALAAITQVKNAALLPINVKTHSKVHIIMPDQRKCEAMRQALELYSKAPLQISCSSLQGFDPSIAHAAIEQADWVIGSHASPQQSAVEIGGMEDVNKLEEFALSRQEQPSALKALLKYAKAHHKQTLFISLRAPYEITQFAPYSDAVLASYAYNIDVDNSNRVAGPAFTALAKVILGQASASGTLPVTIK